MKIGVNCFSHHHLNAFERSTMMTVSICRQLIIKKTIEVLRLKRIQKVVKLMRKVEFRNC